MILPLAGVSNELSSRLRSWTANKKKRRGGKKRATARGNEFGSNISCLFSVNTNESFYVDAVKREGPRSHGEQMYAQFEGSHCMACKIERKSANAVCFQVVSLQGKTNVFDGDTRETQDITENLYRPPLD